MWLFGTKIEVVANWYFLKAETLHILRQQEVEKQERWQITLGLYGEFISEHALVKVDPKTRARLAHAQWCKHHFAPETKSKVGPKKNSPNEVAILKQSQSYLPNAYCV